MEHEEKKQHERRPSARSRFRKAVKQVVTQKRAVGHLSTPHRFVDLDRVAKLNRLLSRGALDIGATSSSKREVEEDDEALRSLSHSPTKRTRSKFLRAGTALVSTSGGQGGSMSALHAASMTAGANKLHTASPQSTFSGLEFDGEDHTTEKKHGVYFSPLSTFRRVWCIVRLFFVLYFFFVIPYRIAFLSHSFNYTIIADYIGDVFFLFDFLLQLRYFSIIRMSNGQYTHVRKGSEIQKEFFQSKRFLWLLLAIFPADLVGLAFSWKTVYWLRLNRVLHLHTIFLTVNFLTSLHITKLSFWSNQVVRRLARLIFQYCVMAHLFACFFFTLGSHLSLNGYDSWLDASDNKPDVQSLSTKEQYLYSIYWAITTMTTEGYGDQTPVQRSEAVFALVVMLYGWVQSARLIGYLIPFFEDNNKLEYSFFEKLNRLQKYMSAKDVPLETERRIVQYYKYLWERQSNVDENRILSTDIPPIQRMQVGMFLCGDMLRGIPFLSKAPVGFIRSLVSEMWSEVYAPGDVVLSEGQINSNIYLVVGGCVTEQVKHHENDVIITTASYKKNSFFGHDTFADDHYHVFAMMRAVRYTDTMQVSRETFMERLSLFVASSAYDDINEGLVREHTLSSHRFAERLRRVREKLGLDPTNDNSPPPSESSGSGDVVLPPPPSASNSSFPSSTSYSKHSRKGSDVRPVSPSFLNLPPDDDEKPFEKDDERHIIFSPDSTFRKWWDLFLLAGLLYYALVIPFRASFWRTKWNVLTEGDYLLLGLDWCVDIFFVSDIYMRLFHFARPNPDARDFPVLSRSVFRQEYLNDGFILDCISSLPLELLIIFGLTSIGGENILFLRLIHLIRLRHFFAYFRNASVWFEEKVGSFQGYAFVISQLLLTALLLFHIVGSLWYFFGDSEADVGCRGLLNTNETCSWVTVDDNLQDKSRSSRYTRSYYWALLTGTTVGYGGIVPVTNVETIVAVLCIMFITLYYLIVLAKMTTYAENTNRQAHLFEERIQVLKQFMRHNKLPAEIRDRIKSYYFFLWHMQMGTLDSDTLSELPVHLRVLLVSSACESTFMKIPIFQGFEKHPGFVRELIMSLRGKIYPPGDVIYRTGSEIGEVFVVTRGAVLVSRTIEYKETVRGASGLNKGSIQEEEEEEVDGDKEEKKGEEVRVPMSSSIETLVSEAPSSDPGDETRVETVQVKILRKDAYFGEEEILKSIAFIHPEADGSDAAPSATSPSPTSPAPLSPSHSLQKVTYIYEADTSCSCFVLDIGDFNELLKAYPEVQRVLVYNKDNGNHLNMNSDLSLAKSSSQELLGGGANSFGSVENMTSIGYSSVNTAESRDSLLPSSASNVEKEKQNKMENKNSKGKKKTDRDQVNPASIELSTLGDSSTKIRAMASGGASSINLNIQHTDGHLSHQTIFSPKSTFRRYWELLKGTMLFYFAIMVPLRIGFIHDPTSHDHFLFTLTSLTFDGICDLVFLVDVYLRRYHFADFRDGEIMLPEENFANHYRKILPFDLLTANPFDLLALIHSVRLLFWLRLIRLLRLYRLRDFSAKLNSVLETRQIRVKPALLSMARSFVMLFIIAHWFACAWYLIGYEADGTQDPPGWLNEVNVAEASTSLSAIYLRSFYFTLVTMSTVGYGDIKPKTIPETYFGIILIVCGCLVYALVTANVASLAANMDVTAESFQTRMDKLKRFLRRQAVPKRLRIRISDYYRDLWISQKGVEQHKILDELPSLLREDVCEFLYGEMLRKTKVFRNVDRKTLRIVSTVLRHRVYAPNETLCVKGEGSHHLTVIQDGVVHIMDEDKPFATMKVGQTFGENHVLSYEPKMQPFSVRAKTRCEALLLYHTDLLTLALAHPKIANLLPPREERKEETQMISGRKSNRMSSAEAHKKHRHSLRGRRQASFEASWIVAPDGHFRIRWESVALIFAFLEFLFVPFTIIVAAYDARDIVWYFVGVSYVFDLFFSVDLFFRMFRFAPTCDSSWATRPSSHVLMWYFSVDNVSSCVRDILTLLPVDVLYITIISATSSSISASQLLAFALLRLNRLLLLSRLPSFWEYIEYVFDHSQSIKLTFQLRRLLKMCMFIVVSLHWIACLWLLLGKYGGDSEGDSWLDLKGGHIRRPGVLGQYIYALYWAVTTITTTGYGDIYPTTDGEIYYALLVIILGDLLTAAIIGAISANTSSLNAEDASYQRRLEYLRQYMKYRRLPQALRTRILNWQEYMHEVGLSAADEEEVIRDLPYYFHKEVTFDLYAGLVSKVKYFRNCEVAFISSLTAALQRQIYLPADRLCSHNDLSDDLYFLVKGDVFVLNSEDGSGSDMEDSDRQAHRPFEQETINGLHGLTSPELEMGHQLTRIPQFSAFGEMAFFLGVPRTYSIVSHSHSEVLTLSHRNFANLLKLYPHVQGTVFGDFCAHASKKFRVPSSELKDMLRQNWQKILRESLEIEDINLPDTDDDETGIQRRLSLDQAEQITARPPDDFAAPGHWVDPADEEYDSEIDEAVNEVLVARKMIGRGHEDQEASNNGVAPLWDDDSPDNYEPNPLVSLKSTPSLLPPGEQ